MIDLRHGNCLELMKDIPDGSVDMILCDLPYGTTANKWDSVIPLKPLWEQYNRIIKENGAICLFAQVPFNITLSVSNLKMLRYEWIWEKEAGTGFYNAKKMPLKLHENILVFYKRLPTYNPQMRAGFKPYVTKQGNVSSNYKMDAQKSNYITVSDGFRYPVSILRFQRDKEKLHPTQKPVALLEHFVKTYTNPGETVLDNCMGSGSTGVACVNTGRRFIGMELMDKHFQTASTRINAAMAS